MKKIWLENYPDGVPAEIDVNQYGSLVDLLEESFQKYASNDAYILMDKALTYGELDRQSIAMASYLQGLGLKKGDRVAIMMPNVLQYPIAVAGILRAGMIAVNVNPLYTPRELEHQLKDSGSKAIIILENFASTLQEVIKDTPVKHTIVASIGEMLGTVKGTIVNFVVRYVKKGVPSFSLPGSVKFNDALAQGHSKQFSKPDIKSDDVAVLQYTGGTTGLSKGAVLLHSTIIANLLSSEAWMQPGLKKNPPDGQMISICALPLYHVFAFVTCSLLSKRNGGVNVLIPNPRDLDATVKEMAKYRFNIMPGVNTLFNALANHPEFQKLDFSDLGITNGGGTAVQEDVAKQWLDLTGCAICEGYGLSETSSGVTCNPTDSDAFSGTIGLPMPSVEIAILDEDGKEVSLGERGEIAIKGPQVMNGYWENPEATQGCMTKDGFFKSGDVGIMDERGYVKIVDRIKDMILVNGFNVYPTEIEAVVTNHPGVMDAAVIGVPDNHSGEAVKLFVVKKDDALTVEALAEYCAEELTGYKKPKTIEFREDLPKTPVGKILRRELRDEVMAAMKA
jgi:long-chain acyl-CoA synthetase